ncbi:hypothetical protein [Candidatus Neptunichlamydia sp. REUL1]|uniref:hypothetical protein n=1 Tax=Candidatus Neptunichlamydia sp. REUL1 TaxID=3064277 RepID=UPI0029317641|nr:hypothetical protein [Candidatus Neptunochlamydia sp. REUL1]
MMKKITLLFLGTLIIAGGLLVSCEKKEAQPGRGKSAPCHMDQPKRSPPPPHQPCKPCSPCKRY